MTELELIEQYQNGKSISELHRENYQEYSYDKIRKILI